MPEGECRTTRGSADHKVPEASNGSKKAVEVFLDEFSVRHKGHRRVS